MANEQISDQTSKAYIHANDRFAMDDSEASWTTKYITGTILGNHGTRKLRGNILDPNSFYSTDTQIFLFRADAALTITRIYIKGNSASPTSELDIDLKWADSFITLANAAVIDVCDTTSGTVTITSGFDDATIASGKEVYWQFGAQPHADWTQFYFEIFFTYDS